MRILFFLTTVASFMFSFLEARDEVVLTIPKSGTHYLKLIIENIADCSTVVPSYPADYYSEYNENYTDENVVVMGHCEPTIFAHLPDIKNALLMIRDPRDVALSAVDYIDNRGVKVWPGLSSKLNDQMWSRLLRIEKLSFILSKHFDFREFSIISLFDSAVQLMQEKNCFIVKYESLSPKCNTVEELTNSIQEIGQFFGHDVDASQAEVIISNCFQNKSSHTLNKGKAFRYLDEDKAVVDFLESKLSKYIDYFGYSR